ncbi:hypothetical protein D3P96_03045 [Weissella viridescens]|uniref:Uncharacterized protein n=1 Tax=Weissella viridescens TaxID=1629 RepID=A0A3P2RF72_WEIVI|nr:DUF1801 domain-containing protein [Weissella viridescens]RRG18276.1 hypothetical protein D3P96_03045 [Weissella viridescens]
MSEKAGFSDFEKEAMRERAQELRREQENKRSKKNPEADVLETIAEMSDNSAEIAMHIHQLVHELAPDLKAKTWYGMPAYANADNKVVLYFKNAEKFEARYGILGFNDAAHLDAGTMWPVDFAIKNWNDQVAQAVTDLIKKAVVV